ncbi:4Fe-4S ferredoxin, iron-sulfur binding protein [Candidatus Vecturithrix granuli]|uniref:4Fe-4S ferredoxin, iron-sulfur binding protein n=1 Tax=Vecturithrix granuli TaxID=1499967 RepID=A0A081C2E8_VECG1|nr:4Fe-4S ferredoxin, iron-sulfur binding protein [Candidatus Vecturithrix granuli]
MKVQTVKLVYFSPTATTRAIVKEITKGIKAEQVQHLDCTLPGSRTAPMPVFQDELVILAAPVYVGRIAKVAAEHFATFRARNTLAVLVAVYGNRAYEDALRELRDLAVQSGFMPIAGGAFIGEHSYSSEQKPIAHGRPDTQDRHHARAFGAKIREKLQQIETIAAIKPLTVPGNFPYRDPGTLPPMAPVTNISLCTLCGKCAHICPVNAIATENPATSDENICTHCCACIKICPAQARSVQNEIMLNIVNRLHTTCQARKEPEVFL